MKILAVTFHGSLKGGANRSFFMVVNELKSKYGHEVVVAAGDGILREKCEEKNIRYQAVKFPKIITVFTGGIKDVAKKAKVWLKSFQVYLKVLFSINKYRKEKFDLVYINGTEAVFGWYIAKLLKIPFVWHIRGLLRKGDCFVSGQTKKLNDKNGKLIVISNAMLKSIPELFGVDKSQVVLVHNGIDWEDNNLISSQKRENGIHCVICGRIMRVKGHMEAVEALNILKNNGINNVYIHVAGDICDGNSEYLELVKSKIDEYQLNDRVIFEGQVEDMFSFRQNMNIELMCSECEPFGRVTLEGMHSGLVVIGANTGGTIDIIQDGVNGLLYEQGNAQDLAQKIMTVIENVDLSKRLASDAIEFSKTHFTVEQNVSAINDILVSQIRGR